ncbi:acetolactate synthase [Fuerstiella marisgermanici]|uniref:ACT domain-containing protein n=1 Tax=Fuerstiella marisgermanici TaxID=1891926 RepID=A0A1P8WRT1_9PLAN|nr:acetolactate synthase [Fuerstiella marisgermanici]APZ96764.1 ACT domain-containing protein [Fuerstiella marisgermanici]
MSSSFGDDEAVDSMTSRGRDWPCLQQFVVFLENKVGSLHELLRRVEHDDLKIMALTILDSADSAIARLITNNYERTLETLQLSGLAFCETEVIGVMLPDREQPHTSVCGSLMAAELNVHYVYPLMYRRNGRGAVAVYVDNVDEALRVLKERKHEFVTEDDLMEYDDLYG